MNDRMFDRPIFVKDGSRLIQEIACLEDALEFLYDRPRDDRGPIYDTALRRCQSAFEGRYPLSKAKEAFFSFAKSANILEVVTTPLPWATSSMVGNDDGIAA